MKQIEDDLDITVTVERIATYHLTLGIQMTFYLEFFRQCLPKALIKLMLS